LNVYDALEKVLGTEVAEDSTIFNVPRIKPGISKGIAIAGAVGIELMKINEAAKLGPVTAGRLSDMTDNIGISPGIIKLQQDKENKEDPFKGNIINSGVSGEIVFALHNLR